MFIIYFRTGSTKKVGVRYTFYCVLWFCKFEQRLLCRFSDACMTKPSTRANSRRPKSAGARNRGVQGTSGAATYQRAMGI